MCVCVSVTLSYRDPGSVALLSSSLRHSHTLHPSHLLPHALSLTHSHFHIQSKKPICGITQGKSNTQSTSLIISVTLKRDCFTWILSFFKTNVYKSTHSLEIFQPCFFVGFSCYGYSMWYHYDRRSATWPVISVLCPQTLMSVITPTPAARSASTTKGTLSVNATKATRWILSPRPVKLRVSYSSQWCRSRSQMERYGVCLKDMTKKCKLFI